MCINGRRVAGAGWLVQEKCGRGCKGPGTCSTSMKSKHMGSRHLPQELVIFPASVPIDSACGKLERQDRLVMSPGHNHDCGSAGS